MGTPLIVLGTGGHATVVIDMAGAAGVELHGCVGPDAPQFGTDYCRYLGGDELLDEVDPRAFVLAVGIGSTGDASLRCRLFEAGLKKGFAFKALAHPRAVVADRSCLGPGAQVMSGALVNPFAAIGGNAIVNTGAIIEHHVRLGDHAHVAPGAIVCGGAEVGEGAHVGAGATVLQNIRIGARAAVGAGAVVTRDVPPGAVVKGVPAR